jgi:Holliday junction resolvase RusA-like endonuclease
MIMKRPLMNAVKQKWKDMIQWFVEDQGYANLRIEQCEISQIVYYSTNRRHDIDNSVPKFILDGLVESGMIVDDDSRHVKKLTLQCTVDAANPRTELIIKTIK